MNSLNRLIRSLVISFVLVSTGACSGSSSSDSATGGSTGNGGASATGGTPGAGGTSSGGGSGGKGGAGTGGTSGAAGASQAGASGAGGSAGGGGSSAAIGSLSLRGVNLSCAEWGSLPGTFGTDYTYPDSHYVSGYTSPSYYVSKKMTVFRLPFSWERIQPTLSQALSTTESTRLSTTVTDLLATGAFVILDVHNYARYNGTTIGSGSVTQAAFADLWSRLATQYGSEPKIIFGLMNEPHDIDNTIWVNAAQAAITAIRATGATNLILVSSNGWDNAASWSTYADALLTLTDSAGNLAFEAHNYFNSAGSDSSTCVSATIGVERLMGFTSWLQQHGVKGFLGEFSGNSTDANCQGAVTNVLQHVMTNASVYLGWAWWAGGPWWGTNWANIEPSGTTDNPRMVWLAPYL
jgi:endoglucanase